MLLMSDTFFYWMHRLMHDWRWLYRNVHKMHHEFKGSVGIAAEV